MQLKTGRIPYRYHFFWGIYAFVPWLYYCRPARSFPTVKTFFSAFRKAEGSALPVGVAGFCWGGKHTVLLTHEDNYLDSRPMLEAAFTGHPSFLELPTDVEKITVREFSFTPPPNPPPPRSVPLLEEAPMESMSFRGWEQRLISNKQHPSRSRSMTTT